MNNEEIFRSAKNINKKITHVFREVKDLEGEILLKELDRVSKAFLNYAVNRRLK